MLFATNINIYSLHDYSIQILSVYSKKKIKCFYVTLCVKEGLIHSTFHKGGIMPPDINLQRIGDNLIELRYALLANAASQIIAVQQSSGNAVADQEHAINKVNALVEGFRTHEKRR